MTQIIYLEIIRCNGISLDDFYNNLQSSDIKLQIITDYDQLMYYPIFRNDEYIKNGISINLEREKNVNNVFIISDKIDSFTYRLIFTDCYGNVIYKSVDITYNSSQIMRQNDQNQNIRNNNRKWMHNPFFSINDLNKMLDKPYYKTYTYEN